MSKQKPCLRLDGVLGEQVVGVVVPALESSGAEVTLVTHSLVLVTHVAVEVILVVPHF